MEPVRILIVDDEPDAGEILSVRLARHCMVPHYEGDGERALAYLQHHCVDVVLLDVKMPGMDGLEVLERIKAHYPKTIVIMISGHADMDSAANGLELGASHYLLKPIDFEMLLHQIEDACRQRQLCHPEIV